MTTFQEFITNKTFFKHHALLLLSSYFAKNGIPDAEFTKFAQVFCGLSFYESKEVGVYDIAKNHPDVFIADRERKILRLEDIKPIRTFCLYPPQQSLKRLFVIENCERLNTNAANSLLKVLEEPPTACLFLLTSSKLSLVMPTIASRMQKSTESFPYDAQPPLESLFADTDVEWVKNKIFHFQLTNYMPHTSLNETKRNALKNQLIKEIVSQCDRFAKEYAVENTRALLITLLNERVKKNPQFIHTAKFALATLSEWQNFDNYHPSVSLWLIRFFCLFS